MVVSGGLSAARFTAKLLFEVKTCTFLSFFLCLNFKGRRVPILVGRELFTRRLVADQTQCTGGAQCRRHSQSARVAEVIRSRALERLRIVGPKPGDALAWIDTPLPSRSKECEERMMNSLGCLLHGRPGGRLNGLVRRLAGYRPLGLGRVESFRALPSAAPQAQNHTHPDKTVDG